LVLEVRLQWASEVQLTFERRDPESDLATDNTDDVNAVYRRLPQV